MRSRSERKSQARFLVFVSNLLLHIYDHNSVGIKGIRVAIKGRINGVPRSKTWETGQGKMSLQRIDADIDYSYFPSDTVYGTFGIKVWINYESLL
jgi:ribosomal protein S3